MSFSCLLLVFIVLYKHFSKYFIFCQALFILHLSFTSINGYDRIFLKGGEYS
nr:MAG TPA: hypothetical protein [Caudoviricetes sp.]